MESSPAPDSLENIWYTSLFPFVAPFLPPGVSAEPAIHGLLPRPLGLILTRATANLLSGARPPIGGDTHLCDTLGERRAIYVDVPHGALRLAAHPDGRDTLQLRAIFVPPLRSGEKSLGTFFLALLTNPGSEQPRGRICALIAPNGQVSALTGAKASATQADPTLKAPFVHASTEACIRERAADFLHLVLAYYCFGPPEVRESIAATPSRTATERKAAERREPVRNDPFTSSTRPPWSSCGHPSPRVGRSLRGKRLRVTSNSSRTARVGRFGG